MCETPDLLVFLLTFGVFFRLFTVDSLVSNNYLMKGELYMIKKRKIDWLLLLPYLGVSLIGLLIVFSASSYRLMAEGENPLTLFSK